MDWIELTGKVFIPGLAASGAIYKGFLHRRVMRAIANKQQRDQNIAKIPEMATGIAALTAAVRDVTDQLKVNGGGSMRDELRRIGARAAAGDQRMRAMLQSDSASPFFEANARGEWVWSNRAMLALTGRAFEALEGHGWKNIVAPMNRRNVADEWRACISDGRECSIRFALIGPRGLPVSDVVLTALPFTDASDSEDPVGYFGTIEREKTV